MAIVGKTEIGLKLFGSFRSPDLNSGKTFGTFQLSGKVFVVIERLKRSANDKEITGAAFLKSCLGCYLDQSPLQHLLPAVFLNTSEIVTSFSSKEELTPC